MLQQVVQNETVASESLLAALSRLAVLQHESVDRLALREAVTQLKPARQEPKDVLRDVSDHLQVRAAKWLKAPDPSAVPALVCAPHPGGAGTWAILRGQNGQGLWVTEWWNPTQGKWGERTDTQLDDHHIALFKVAPPFEATSSPLFKIIREAVLSQKTLLREILVGSLMINVVTLVASFYSMQVYDRVVPSGASQTLLVLTIGAALTVLFEFMVRHVRSRQYEQLIDAVDQRLSRTVYQRFLSIRIDQLPPSVGALASQIRGYESVRSFFTSVTTNLLIDAPFALLFMMLIFYIGGGLALVPFGFFMLSVGIGFYNRRRVESFSKRAMAAGNFKTGLLVESVEGAETIKSGQGGWRMLNRWLKTTTEARESELQLRHITEHSQHLTTAFQQLSYIALVACGALWVSKGELTMGALIACSILAGRVLSPVAMIQSQLVQWANTRAALQGLDRLWRLEDDHHGQAQPVLLEDPKGDYRIESLVYFYGPNRALSIANLVIRPGEKLGVLGPIGSGKSTFLRLLSGMYKPKEGRILFDDVDLAHIAKPVLAESMGYVQQDGRLFAGTLRDNLLLGLMDPGDEAILEVARQTGLFQTVISKHPKGLQQDIFEGGTGLSGGQRQLVNLTRAFLRKPKIWLLDEPTASMDRQLELQVTTALADSLGAHDTLVLVTHKLEMLALVDRLVVIANHQVVLDGPKALVLQQLQGQAQDASVHKAAA